MFFAGQNFEYAANSTRNIAWKVVFRTKTCNSWNHKGVEQLDSDTQTSRPFSEVHSNLHCDFYLIACIIVTLANDNYILLIFHHPTVLPCNICGPNSKLSLISIHRGASPLSRNEIYFEIKRTSLKKVHSIL